MRSGVTPIQEDRAIPLHEQYVPTGYETAVVTRSRGAIEVALEEGGRLGGSRRKLHTYGLTLHTSSTKHRRDANSP